MQQNPPLFYRLTALWVVIEAFLGGLIHGLKLPVSGLLVGSAAICIISLLAFYFNKKGVILKATLLVVFFKFLLSPHSPPTAYVAVLFQGLIAEVLFWNRKYFKLSCITFGLLALIESAVQRIAVLMILFGLKFWQAVNDWLSKLFHQSITSNYSLWMAIGYIILHAVLGLFVGIWMSKLPQKINNWKLVAQVNNASSLSTNIYQPKKNKYKNVIWILPVWLCLFGLVVWGLLKQNSTAFALHWAVQLCARMGFILLTWYWLVIPLFSFFLKKFINKVNTKYAVEIKAVQTVLPFIQQLIQESIKETKESKGIKKWKLVFKKVITGVVYDK